MSKRFGRSQRRAARQKIASLEQEVLWEQGRSRMLEEQREAARRETRAVVKAVEEIAPMSAAIEPTMQQLRNHTDQFWAIVQPSRPALGLAPAHDYLSEPIGAEHVILNRLAVEVVADHVRRGLWCRATIQDTGAVEVFVTLEALRSARARDLIVREVAARLVCGLAAYDRASQAKR